MRDAIVRGMIQRLEALEQAGVTNLPRSRIAEHAERTADTQSVRPKPATDDVPSTPGKSAEGEVRAAGGKTAPSLFEEPVRGRPSLSLAERVEALAIVEREVAACRRCAELAATRTQTVFGVGNPQTRLCFLGEAPGADEDAQGEPFVGRAGQLLNRIIAACTLRREDVYILNVLKCRPPGNRNPLPEEAANCRGFLDRQLEIIAPEYICCLGSVAAHNLLKIETPIGRLRGRFLDYQGIPVLCTYHPAYLLRNPSAKAQVWDDMQLLMAKMGIELPKKNAR